MFQDFWDGKPEMDISGYLASEEWSIVNNTAVRNNVTYPCCADAYSDLTFTLVLRRNPGFYTRLLLLPAILLSSLVLVIFWIPPQRPDRTSLGKLPYHTIFPRKHESLSRCRFNVGDGGPALKLHWINVSSLLGLSTDLGLSLKATLFQHNYPKNQETNGF